MILYCDTSALVKRYIIEQGTETVDKFWERASYIATSTVAYAEAIAAFGRKKREGLLSEIEYKLIVKHITEDYRQFILVPVSTQLNSIIRRLIERHPLRGFDAIHLASAILLFTSGINDLIFSCFDRQLSEAALIEGLTVIS